jgi:transposase-like protein
MKIHRKIIIFMKRKYSRTIRKIARREGVSPEVVYAELQQAIEAGRNNPDPAA